VSVSYHEIMISRRPYPSDLSDARWALFEPTLTAWRAARLQARRAAGFNVADPTTSLRDVLDAILYVNRTGIAWRYLPHDFPPHQTVYGYFAAWTKQGIFERLGLNLTALARAKAGRHPAPTAAVVDTQSVKTSTNVPLTSQGTDPGKKIVGRKRGIATDVLGLLLAVVVTAASLSDNTVGTHLLNQTKTAHPTLTKAWTDAGFKNTFIEHAATLGIDIEVVSRTDPTPGFHVIHHRWVAERSLGWLMLHRRLNRDYETLPAASESMIWIAMADNLARRITDETTPTWRGT
jgi:transposase